MNLIYRGHSYAVSAPNHSGASSEQPKVKMIYRGHTYYTVPGASFASDTVETESVTETLTYRGHVYESKLRLPKLPQPIRALSWRYQSV